MGMQPNFVGQYYAASASFNHLSLWSRLALHPTFRPILPLVIIPIQWHATQPAYGCNESQDFVEQVLASIADPLLGSS